MLNAPMNRRFLDVDDALTRCSDQLPCQALEHLVMLEMPSR
jgi:hypothetical protein